MVQCEMCGAETGSPKTVKIEGAELQVCADCADFGTEVTQQTSSSTSTKYSTSSSSNQKSSSSPSSSTSKSGSRRRRDMFDQMEELASDFHQRIKQTRENEDLTQEELANSINEKVSLIRKLEHGDIQPSDEVQRKLEKRLDISLTEDESVGDEDWESGSTDTGLTLGDMVKRKD